MRALLTVLLLPIAISATTGSDADRLEIRELQIASGPDVSGPVGYALGELTRFAGPFGIVRIGSTDRPGSSTVPVLLVGRQMVQETLGTRRLEALGIDKSLGPEGFVLTFLADRKPPTIVAAGWTDRGTRWAIYDLIKSLNVSSSPMSLPLPLNRRETPDFRRRGMYAHQHWEYRYPYALRSWDVDDWKRYVDLLAYFRYNLLQIWSMASILPVPLSPADEAWLRRYRDVIDHAHLNHGMEVWIGECANNVSEGIDLPPIAERDYFAAETLKDPGDPEQFRQVMHARDVFYSTVINADGYWIIDSDPGGWRGSSTGEFVEILAGNRRLINRRTGANAKLIYWMWQGWGTGSREENWRKTVQWIKDEIRPMPWFLACKEGHIQVIRDQGLESRSMYFPYNAVEPEPSTPYTNFVPTRLRDAVEVGRQNRDLAGIMGNAQTPLVQLPNLFFFGQCAWDLDERDAPAPKLAAELARLIFPKRADELARGWMALSSSDPGEVLGAARALERLVVNQSLGQSGPVGLKISPRPEVIVEDLAMMLKTHALGLEFRKKAADPATPDEEAIASFAKYILQTIAWRHRTGFKKSPWDPCTSPAVYSAAHKRWGTPEGHQPEKIIRLLREAIEAQYGREEAEYALGPISPKQ